MQWPIFCSFLSKTRNSKLTNKQAGGGVYITATIKIEGPQEFET